MGSQRVRHGWATFTFTEACGILVPQPGIEPVPPALSLNLWSTREVCLAVPWMCQPHSRLGIFALVLCANWNTLPSDIHSQVTSAEVCSDHRLFCRHTWLPSSCSFLFDVGFHSVIYKTLGLSSLFLIPALSSEGKIFKGRKFWSFLRWGIPNPYNMSWHAVGP